MHSRRDFLKNAGLIAAAGAVAGYTPAIIAAPTRTLRLSHNLPASTVAGRSLDFFAKRVDTLTSGEIKVDVYPNGQIGDQDQSMQQVQSGILDMAKSNTSALEKFDSVFEVLDIPYLFKNKSQYRAFFQSKVGSTLLTAPEQKGFIGLTYFTSGARSFYATSPLDSIQSLNGLKIRVQKSNTAIKMVKLLGANPTPLPFGQVYLALQNGLLDGAENNPTALVEAKHGEVAKHFMFDEHTRVPDFVAISTSTWKSLSRSHRSALQKAANDALKFQLDAWDKSVNKDIDIAKNKMHVKFTRPNKAPFREATKPLYKEIAHKSKRNKKIVSAIENL